MKNISIVPATPALVEQFYHRKSTVTQRAFIVFENDDPIAIFGMYLHKSRFILFSDIRPDVHKNLKAYRRTIIQCSQKIKEYIERANMPVNSVADRLVEGTDVLLTHIGFEEVSEGVYEWHG